MGPVRQLGHRHLCTCRRRNIHSFDSSQGYVVDAYFYSSWFYRVHSVFAAFAHNYDTGQSLLCIPETNRIYRADS